jgi:hypothetical protein
LPTHRRGSAHEHLEQFFNRCSFFLGVPGNFGNVAAFKVIVEAAMRLES